MLFYTSLFIASLFAALVVHWVYHAIADAGQALFKNMLPGTKTGPTSHLGTKKMRTTTNGTPTPWGWKSHDTPANMAKTYAAKPASMRQNPYTTSGSDPTQRSNAGWVHREEKSELGGKAYKVTRKVSATAAGFKTASRPWGW
jgi:hypothetical protein